MLVSKDKLRLICCNFKRHKYILAPLGDVLPGTINRELIAIRHYFNSINHKNNPVNGLKVKGTIKSIPNNLLDETQLYQLYDDFNVDPIKPSSSRDKVILGLMVFQGLRSKDLQSLQSDHIDLNRALISVPSTSTRNERMLKLDSKQMIDLHNYMENEREKLRSHERSERLLLSGGMSHSLNGVLQRLMKRLTKQNQQVQSLNQIVSSVYALWLTKHNLREVQYMAGHKYVSSTEKYKKADLRELQQQLGEFFPDI